MMNTNKDIREKILNQPSYWVEKINGCLFDAIVNYMDQHRMKQKDIAKLLDLTPGRVSQILNDGDINFSLDKIIQIALKVDKFPSFEFIDKCTFIEKEQESYQTTRMIISYNTMEVSRTYAENFMSTPPKIVSINDRKQRELTLAL